MRWLGDVSLIGYKRPRVPAEIIRYGLRLCHHGNRDRRAEVPWVLSLGP